MLKRIQAYQTSDNRTFPNRIQALSHEFMIDLRGAIQKKTNSNSLSSTDIASILVNDAENVSDIIHRYRVAINRAKAATDKKN